MGFYAVYHTNLNHAVYRQDSRYFTNRLEKEMLPIQFTERMQKMLGDEYEAFEASYAMEKKQALRFNPLKGEKEAFLEKVPFSLSKVEWSQNGYYYEKEDAPGKHPYHEAGVYYIQEPSAQTPAQFLEAKPGERILDLCSAPGGKATQIAGAMNGEGLLVCNEYVASRAKILSENVERMGIRNALVVNETPQKLAGIFPGYFHRIMVDAPCSGEGMFRKNEEAHAEWSPENVRMCADRQDEILDAAAEMLLPGGRMVYSTCTFAPLENECSIARFLMSHRDFSVVEVTLAEGMSAGNPDWAETEMGQLDAVIKEQLQKTIRLWPHKCKGEGHYVAVLQKDGSLAKDGDALVFPRNGIEKTTNLKSCKEFEEFIRKEIRADWLTPDAQNGYFIFHDNIYLLPKDMPTMKGLKVHRSGLQLGMLLKNRFEPAHALALALRPDEVVHTWNLSSDSEEIRSYLKGNTFPAEGEKGWYLITVDGYSIGWGKLAGGIMKNHYPKGLRK